MTEQTLPSGGGAYERKADGTLAQTEAATAPRWSAEPAPEAVEPPVEGAVKGPVKRSGKEA